MIGSTTMGVSLIWMLVLLTGLVLLVIWIVKLLFPQGGDASTPQGQDSRESDLIDRWHCRKVELEPTRVISFNYSTATLRGGRCKASPKELNQGSSNRATS